MVSIFCDSRSSRAARTRKGTNTMRHHNTLLHALLQFIPWSRLEALVEEHGSDRGVRKLSSKSQLIALLHAQLSGASSLREVEATLASQSARLYHLGASAPKRSTLAEANANRPADAFCGLFETLLAQDHAGLRRASREAVRLIDATTLPLTAHAQGWAGSHEHGCGAKLHVVLDPDAALPVNFVVTSRRVNDITPAKAMPIEAGAAYVYDLGCSPTFLVGGPRRAGLPLRHAAQEPYQTDADPGRARSRRAAASLPTAWSASQERLARQGPARCWLDRPLREVRVCINTGKILRIVSNDLEAPARSSPISTRDDGTSSCSSDGSSRR